MVNTLTFDDMITVSLSSEGPSSTTGWTLPRPPHALTRFKVDSYVFIRHFFFELAYGVCTSLCKTMERGDCLAQNRKLRVARWLQHGQHVSHGQHVRAMRQAAE